MAIAKVKEKSRFFFQFSFHTAFSTLRRNVSWLSSKQLTLERSTPNIWSLKTCGKVGFLSDLLSWNLLTFRALSLRRITTALFVSSGVVSRHNKSIKIDFPPSLMIYHRKISAFIKKTKCDGKLGIYQRLDIAKKHIQKYHFKLY